MKKICVSDVTLVSETQKKTSLSFREKIETARQLDKLGVDVIELPEVKDPNTDTLLTKTVASFVSNGTLSVPVALDGSDLETVDAALAKAKKRRLRLCVPASYVRMEYSCHKKPGKILEIVPETLKKCKEKCGDLELFVEDATRADEAFLKDLVTSAVEAGVTAVTFADDEGATMPDEFGAFIADQKKNIPALEKVRVGAFCSNAFGLSLTSLLAAIKAGADEIKLCAAGSACATVGAFAAIVNAKGEKLGWKTDMLYTELNRICAQIAWTTDTKRSETSPFDSGVSDHSLPETELCEDDDISAVSAAVRKLGYDLSEEDDARVFEAFKRVAAKKPVGAKELDAIVASSALQVPATYKLISYVINSGNVITASAHIELEKDGQKLSGIALGDGPIDAAFLAVEKILGHHFELDDFQIQAVTEGREAMGSALVKLRNNGKLYSGNGISTDIIGASVRAYINALNKIVYGEN